MAVVTRVVAMSAQMKINMGQTSSGTVRTSNLSFGALNPEAWDPEKAYKISGAVNSCLDHSVHAVHQIVTNSISD